MVAQADLFRKGSGGALPAPRRLILASSSPRRERLLSELGLPFAKVPPLFDEGSVELRSPSELALELARGKARSVACRYPEDVVLGADTVVYLEGEVLGKPGSREEAKAMLRALSGRRHEVFTGVCLVCLGMGLEEAFVEVSSVFFRDLSEEEIEAYANSGEPMDKAGAYAVQGKGASLVRRVEGCFYNVVGLPVSRVCEALSRFGIRPHLFWVEGGSGAWSDF